MVPDLASHLADNQAVHDSDISCTVTGTFSVWAGTQTFRMLLKIGSLIFDIMTVILCRGFETEERSRYK